MTLLEIAREGYTTWRGSFRGEAGAPPHWDTLTEREKASYIAVVEFTAQQTQRGWRLFDGSESHIDRA